MLYQLSHVRVGQRRYHRPAGAPNSPPTTHEEPVGAIIEGMAEVRQCPFCELRFTSLNELKAHIALEHPDRSVPERRYRLGRRGPR